MRLFLSRAGRLRSDRRGVTIIEFAMILPALCIVLLGTFELGWRMYVASVLQGALHDAARMATVGNRTNAEIDTIIRQKLSAFNSSATITTGTKSYYDFTQVSTPERITSDTAPVGQFNAGDCYEDYNNNSTYDVDRGRSGMGNSEDIVRYEVSITYPRMFPIAGFLGWSNNQTITSNTVLRNQPYAGRTNYVPPVRCTTA
jgi:Flp pilus assembly protein TadG